MNSVSAQCRSVFTILVLGAVVTFAPRPSSAILATLTDDSYVTDTSPTIFGKKATLKVQDSSTHDSSAYLKFDVDTLPAGVTPADVDKATLILFVQSLKGIGSVSVYEAANTPSWAEGSINTTNVPAVTGAPLDTQTPPSKFTFLALDVTGAVLDWLSTPSNNNGFVLLPGTGANMLFDSKESKTTSKVPMLQITLKTAVTSANIVDGTVQNADIANATITGAKIASGTITSGNIGTGAVTGANIADGTITSADLASGAVTSASIADGTVTGTDIAAGTITNSDIAAGTINNSNIQSGAVTSASIADGTIASQDFAADAVNTIALADGSVTRVKMANNAVQLTWNSNTSASVSSSLSFIALLSGIGVVDNEKLMITSHCGLGSTAVGGGQDLDLYICYRRTSTPVDPGPIALGTGILNEAVPQNMFVPMGLSAVTPTLTAGSYSVGLCALSSVPASWSFPKGCYTTVVGF